MFNKSRTGLTMAHGWSPFSYWCRKICYTRWIEDQVSHNLCPSHTFYIRRCSCLLLIRIINPLLYTKLKPSKPHHQVSLSLPIIKINILSERKLVWFFFHDDATTLFWNLEKVGEFIIVGSWRWLENFQSVVDQTLFFSYCKWRLYQRVIIIEKSH